MGSVLKGSPARREFPVPLTRAYCSLLYWPVTSAVFLLLVSLNVFQLMRNWRVTSLISLPSRTTKNIENPLKYVDLKPTMST